MTVPLTAGTCDVDAAGGDVVPPQCVAGVALPGTVTPVAVDGVTYVPAEASTVSSR